MFVKGENVYCSKPNIREIKVLKDEGIEILCEYEEYISGQMNIKTGWHKRENSFYYFDLRKAPFEDSKELRVKNKWEKIINRIPNMYTSVSYFYKKVLTGKVNLNPVYQRDCVWTLKQKQHYIENLFIDKASITPTIILNWNMDGNFDIEEVLDGKQRLTTIFDFIENKFPLENGMLFKNLCMSDTRFLLNHDIRYTRIEKFGTGDLTLDEKIELFLEINELGTKMSDEHLENVKKMMEV